MSTIKVYLAIDLFFQDWQNDGPLWACLQPHVVKSDLEEWISNIEKSKSNTQYEFFVKETQVEPNDLVPVPFPSDLEFTLTFAATAPIHINNPRTTEPLVLNATQILRDNVSPQYTPQDHPGLQDNTAFSFGYNRNLCDALKGLKDAGRPYAEDLASTLRMGFWGGTRWIIDHAAVDALGPNTAMLLPSSHAGKWVTNLHSLCGLMVRVGTSQDVSNLKSVTAVVLRLSVNGVAQDVVVPAAANTAVAAFFSSLSSPLPAPDVQISTGSDRAKSVFVRESFIPFALLKSPNTLLFRRHRESAAAELTLKSGKLKRVSAMWGQPQGTTRESITWYLYRSFELTFTPYRGSRSTGASALLQVKPTYASDYSEFCSLALRDRDWPSHAIAFDSSGNRVALPNSLGTYYFPWDNGNVNDSTPRTVLVYGPPPPSNNLTVLFPSLDTNGAPLSIATNEVTEAPIGERCWQGGPPEGFPDISFDTLMPVCSDESVGLSDLHVGVSFKGDYTFELAQSIGNIGIAIDASYPIVPIPSDPGHVTAQNEYRHDLVNFNALNLTSIWGHLNEGALNPYSEIYPFDKGQDPTGTRYVNHFSYQGARASLAPPDPRSGEATSTDPRLFFAEIYGSAGIPRSVTVALEHTYGVEIAAPGNFKSNTYLDFPPTLPSDVAYVDAGGKQQPFVTLSFDATNYMVTLTFELAILRSAWEQEDVKNRAPIRAKAWRAIAELAYAGAVRLRGLFRAFDYNGLLNSADSTKFINGFRPVGQMGNWQIVLDDLKSRCANWMLEDEPQNGSVSIPLDVVGFPRITEVCDIFELQLEVERHPSVIPPVAQNWDFLEPQGYFGVAASRFGPMPTPPIQAFTTWIADLQIRTTALQIKWPDPNDPTAKATAKFLRVIGGTQSSAHAAWIANPYRPLIDRSAITVCPLSFLPVSIDQDLGKATFTLLKAYFKALEIVRDCAISEGSPSDATEWSQYLLRLESAVPQFTKIIDKTVGLVEALPNPKNAALRPELKEVLDNPSLWFNAFSEWIREKLWNSPHLFATTAAFLYSRVQSPDGTPITGDLIRLLSAKLVGDVTTAGANLTTDVHRITVRDGLAPLSGTSWFGFPETLEDTHYSYAFKFSRLALTSFPTLFHSILESPSGRDVTDVITQSWVYPAGQQLPPGPQELPPQNPSPLDPKPSPAIYLASREPLWPPIHIRTAVFDIAQRYHGMDALDHSLNGGFDLNPDEFRKGQLVLLPTAGTAGVRMMARATTGQRSGRLDTKVMSILLNVFGNGEPFPDCYRSDDFYLMHKPAPLHYPGAAKTDVVGWGATFHTLLSNNDIGAIPGLADIVLDSNTLARLPLALRNEPDANQPPIAQFAGSPRVRIKKEPGSGNAVLEIDHATGLVMDAFVFRDLSAAVPQDFIMIDIERPIWQRWNLALIQTRNLSLHPGPAQDFNAGFGSATAPVSGDRPLQAMVAESLPLSAPTEIPRILSAEALVAKLLQPNIISSSDDWKTCPLSVTVFRERRVAFESSWRAGAEGVVRKDVHRFPIRNFRFGDGWASAHRYDEDLEWFPRGCQEFSVDFQWSTPNNLEFLRLSNGPVIARR